MAQNNWHDLAQSLKPEGRALIAGELRESASGETFTSENPATGRALAAVASCAAEDVERAVRSARSTFEAGHWSRLAPTERKKRLVRLAELMQKHAAELALLETLNMGKPITDSVSVDVPVSVTCIAWMGEAIDKLYDEIAPTDPSVTALITREPLGVVGAVVPWNFPLLMACWKVGPALAAGNSLVLKPAEQSPLSAIALGKLALEADIPPGVLNVVPGFGETAGQALGLHHDVDAISFTGSTEVGKYFLRYAAESNMKRVSLECGGKTPHIVMGDCEHMDEAVQAAAFGVFYNQGEVCNAGSRLLIHSSIKQQFLDKLVKFSAAFTPGDPLDPATKMGAIVSKPQLDRVLHYIDLGQREGASLRLGGTRERAASGGYFVAPTIFDQVDSRMTIAREEIFGPVLSTIAFNSEEEAVRIANDTMYGLAAAVWTRNIDVALRTAKRLRAGSVWVNCFDEGNISVPFGGFKQSGFGRDKSLHAIKKYTDLKTTWIKIRQS
jgi:gamma-glutamyl-gamma-aminobutyraldehyde dehydrogenase/4-guanidinobutyraldehyde dehydrogenase/NAD-dependent aldehyde dehydrogenase